MDVKNRLNAHNLVYSGIITIIFLLLAASSFLNMGRPGYNKEVLFVYGLGAAVGAAASGIFMLFGVLNFVKRKATGEELPFQAGFVSESSDLMPLSKTLLGKYIPHLVFAAVVVIATVGGFQIWPQPDIYAGVTEFATTTSEPLATQEFGFARAFFDVAVLPAFTEDMASLVLNAFFVMLFAGLVFLMGRITKSPFFRYGVAWHIAAVLITAPLAAVGLGFIPGFAQAHTASGGSIEFLFATFVFQTFNLYVMWFTGLFLPLAHLLHNALFITSFAFAFSIALSVLPMMPKTPRKKIFHVIRKAMALPIFNIKNQVRWFAWE